MIGKKAEAVLNRAVRFAVEHDHEYFTLEHVLWSLLAEGSIVEIVRACGGDSFQLRKDLEAYLEKEIPRTTADPAAPKKTPEPAEEGGSEHPVATLAIQRLIQRALFQVQSSGKGEIQPQDLFVATFQAKESQALHLLAKQGIERLDVLSFISHGVRKDDSAEDDESADGGEDAPELDEAEGESLADRIREAEGTTAKGGRGPAVTADNDPLKLYATDLNARARAGKIDPLVGRQTELDRMIQTLCRRRKNNPLLVGEAGVGKTALAEGLALRIVEGKVPELLKNAIVYALDLGAVMAGTKFRGDFEGRIKKIFQALERKRERGRQPILMIDEIHTIIGAGAVSGGALDAANLIKPLLSRGELQIIGSTTYNEYRTSIEKDHALARRFQKIDIVEPTLEEAVQILQGVKSRFEEHHGVAYTSEAIRAAVELAQKHITDRFLPDKAIDLIDEAGAKARLKGLSEKSERGIAQIDAAFIEEVVAQIARIPARSVNTSQKSRLKNLERDLKISIFGQDHAVDALVTAIRLARSGLRSGDRPVGSFLFCGPTGVGKTELSKQLAHCMGVPFLRYDMSEYGEKHTISRLIGAPPGYVGFEQAGMLTTDAVIKNPHSVVLLDEIEKAHPDIWNILLQVMDHGVLTDNNGRKADFRNIILIMTSNVGSREMERRPLGMSSQSDASAKSAAAQKAVEAAFSPEFRNRIDSTVSSSKGVDVEVGEDVRAWLAEKGYDRQMGARPMARLIQDRIKKPLSEEILFGKLEHGGRVKLSVKAGEIVFDVIESNPPKGSAPGEGSPAPAKTPEPERAS